MHTSSAPDRHRPSATWPTMKSIVFIALLLIFIAAARAREMTSGSGRPPGRQLLAGCDAECSNCTNAGTGVGAVCRSCHNNLVVLRNLPVDDPNYMSCGCSPGQHLQGTGSAAHCLDCSKGFYCLGARAPAAACPDNMDTAATKAKKIIACLEKPGYAYRPPATGDGAPSAVFCANNTFNPGYKRALCRRCTAGFVIQDNSAVRTSPDLCVTPPGWFVNQAGVAARCPRGEYKQSFDLAKSCLKCPKGVTTERTASTSVGACNTLKPGFTGSLISLEQGVDAASVTPCPMSSFCTLKTLATAGVEAAQPCPGGLWTRDVGAASEVECMVPPGHWYDHVANTTQKCNDGAFRSHWAKPSDQAAWQCTPCGEGIAADSNQMALPRYSVTGAVTSYVYVAGSEEACYVEPGMGMYSDGGVLFKGVNCTADNVYGAPERLFGLANAPCRLCPLNMKTTFAAAADRAPGSGFANSPDACLNQPGFGLEGRASEQCRKGTFSPGKNRDPCVECGPGLTTKTALPDDVGATSSADCVAEAGFQVVDGTATECPTGMFNDGTSQNCTQCPSGTTTETSGSSSSDQCELCLPGYCGSDCSAATSGFYAPGGPAETPCRPCPVSTDFMFQFPGIQEADLVFTSATLSAPASQSRASCVAEYAQLSNSAPITAGDMVTQAAGLGLQGCIQACNTALCQFLNFDYATSTCSIRTGQPGKNTADNVYYVLAFKQVNAGSAGANSIAHAKSAGSGFFSFYEDSAAMQVQDFVGAPASSTMQQCLSACTMDESCAAVRATLKADGSRTFDSCGWIKPAVVPNGQVRSLIRADVVRTSLQSLAASDTSSAGQTSSSTAPWVSPTGGRCPSVVTTEAGYFNPACPSCNHWLSTDGMDVKSGYLEGISGAVTDSHGTLFILERYGRLSTVDAAGKIWRVPTAYTTYDPPQPVDLANGAGPLAIDSKDNIYIIDTVHMSIIKVAPSGTVTRVAGTGYNAFGGEGLLGHQTHVSFPGYLAVDGGDNVYFSDTGYGRIRKIDALTGIITTVVGNGTSCANEPDITATKPTSSCIQAPITLAVSADGKTISFDNGGRGQIRRARDGLITALPSQDLDTNTNNVMNMFIDPAGDLLFTMLGDYCIRKFNDATGEVTRVAGICGQKVMDVEGKDALVTTNMSDCPYLFWRANTLIFNDGYNYIRKITYNC